MTPQDFAAALAAEMEAAGITQAALAQAVGVAQNTVSRWVARDGFTPTDAAIVFAIEAFLDLDPGSLSKHLGYLPLGQDAPPVSTIDAIYADKRLDDIRREALLGVYKTFTSKTRATTGRRLVG